MARNYAALPHDYLEEMSELNDEEFGRLIRALLAYSMTGNPIELCGNERFYSKRVMSQEDRFQTSYEEQTVTLSERGKAGAKARWGNAKNAKACLSITSNAKNGNTETDTETKTNTLPPNGGKGVRRFTPPTLAEVQSYVAERHSPVDPQEFIDFYASKGWMVGKTPMKDWKAACRNAEKWDRWSKGEKELRKIGVPAPPRPPAEPGENLNRMRDYLKRAKEGQG